MARSAVTSNPIDSLTPREREVARLMARGLTNPQIAGELGIGFGTAKTHVSQVIAKLGATSREEATATWRREQALGRRMHRGITGLFGLAGWKAVAAAGAGVAALAVAVPIAAVLLAASGDDDDSPGVSSPMVFVDQWERLPDPPIPPRSNVVAVWTGEEALFVGGDTFVCSPVANCVRLDLALDDGAAYNPQSNTWRRVADAPLAFSHASTAAVDGDVYFLVWPVRGGEQAFLRFRIEDDQWDALPLPQVDATSYQLAATDSQVVAFASSHERGALRDYVFDPGAGRWTELPADPIAPSFDRSIAWADGELFLFSRELPGVPGSSRPANLPIVVQAARYDFESETWQRLPDSEILSSGPWYVEGGLIVNPALGGADGGEVDNWGRTYPYGGIFDTRASTWLPLPAVPADSDYWTGVLGSEGGAFFGVIGYFLDLETNTWVQLPDLDDPDLPGRRNVLAAGTDVIVFGGERWDTGSFLDPEAILADAWIWRSGR